MRATALATIEWVCGIRDPRRDDLSHDAMTAREHIHERYICDGLDWGGWVKSYPGDGAFKWCGAFAAYCWATVDLKLRKKFFASTYRLSEYGRLNPARKVATKDIQPGDIVTVGSGDYGAHICIAIAWDHPKAELVTVSGNGMGRLPDGSWGEGVVMTVYPRQELRAAYRPIEGDLVKG